MMTDKRICIGVIRMFNYVKLNEDMISYSGEIVQVENKPEHYQEGPWVYKRNGIITWLSLQLVVRKGLAMP